MERAWHPARKRDATTYSYSCGAVDEPGADPEPDGDGEPLCPVGAVPDLDDLLRVVPVLPVVPEPVEPLPGWLLVP